MVPSVALGGGPHRPKDHERADLYVRLQGCGRDIEVRQDFHDAALTDCPHCGGQLRKAFTAVGVVFKGSGFYRNDSREQAKQPEKAASGSSDGRGESTSKTSSEKGSDKGPTRVRQG